MNITNKSPIRSPRIQDGTQPIQKLSYWENHKSNQTISPPTIDYGNSKNSRLSPHLKNKSTYPSEEAVTKIKTLQLALSQAIQQNDELRQQLAQYEALFVAAAEENQALQEQVRQLTEQLRKKGDCNGVEGEDPM